VAEVASLLAAGEAALAGGEWVKAREAFGELVERDATAESLSGLGTAYWWLGDVRKAFSCWERAYGIFTRTDPAEAVGLAVALSLLNVANAGNRVVARGWARRAVRLAEPLGVPALSAWALLAGADTEEDLEQAALAAETAHQIALEEGDHDLELCALSMRGSVLIDLGQVEAGTALLDEALTGALGGEGSSLDTVVFTSCVLMQCCVRGADFSRVVHWTRSLDDFIARYGCPYLNAVCRASYGAVLVSTGDWARAEVELAAAAELARESLPAVRAQAAAYLADLRLAQGRVGEAQRLLEGFEDHLVVRPVLAAAYLAAEEYSMALSYVQRQLSSATGLEEARLREVAGEACLALGDVEGAAAEGQRLAELGSETDSVLITARAERLLGRASGAVGLLTSAQARFSQLEMPFELARTRMALAVALEAEHPESAVAEVRRALAVFEDLGASGDADRAAKWLRSAGAAAARVGPRGVGVLTKREQDVLRLLAEGLPNPEIAERLYISRRTVEHHVASLLSKLGLRNRTEAAAFALHDQK
jgi:DNA-binding CsgD family transcriptional regulator